MPVTQPVLDEMARLAVVYVDLFTVEGKAADPGLVAAAVCHRASAPRRIVVTDDHGVQAVCLLERIELVPWRAYRALAAI